MNPDPDYSAAYVVLETDSPGIEGHGLAFTIGRGNDLVVAAIAPLASKVVGRSLSSITANWGLFWRELTSDSQLRWLGPEKGVVHLATAAVVNALWDLQAKAEGKPLWRLLAEMSPEEVVRAVDFRYITDALNPDEALAILEKLEPTKERRDARSFSTAAIPRTPPPSAGSAIPTRRSAASVVRPSPRVSPRSR